jgi:uncharacterized membrane protein YqgA involved in biofilm formation
MAEVDVEGGKLILAHGMNLLNVDEFAVGRIRKASIGVGSGRKGDFFCETR